MKLSIIIPCFNEENTIREIIEKINNKVQVDKEIIVVDDFSSDKTRYLLQNDLKDKISQKIKKIFTKGSLIKTNIFFLELLMINNKQTSTKQKSATNLLNTNPKGIRQTRNNCKELWLNFFLTQYLDLVNKYTYSIQL